MEHPILTLQFMIIEANIFFEDLVDIQLSSEKNKTLTQLPLNKEFRDNFMKSGKEVLSGGPHQEERYFKEFDKYFKILYFTHVAEVDGGGRGKLKSGRGNGKGGWFLHLSNKG